MPLANIALVVVKGKVDAQDYRNVLYFGSDTTAWDAAALATLTTLAGEVMEAIVDGLLPQLSNDIHIEGVSAKRVFPTLTDEVFVSEGAGVGAQAGDHLPSFNSQMLDIKTGGGGRRNRGRMFLPPPLESDQQHSELIPSGITKLDLFRAELVSRFLGTAGSSVWELGVLSRAAIEKDNAAINVAFKSATSITSVKVVAVQRRRKLGKGS